jgi:HEPN domain-containing protein/predicted nucleotidyltransferase
MQDNSPDSQCLHKKGDPYILKTSLDHLSLKKQQKIEEIKQTILENTNRGVVQMIILFGSHATGKWVNERYFDKKGTLHHYVSDIDLLVVTRTTQEANKLEESGSVEEATETISVLATPSVQLIAHGASYFKQQIEEQQYFFMDILSEGILFFDNGKKKLVYPGPLTTERRLEKAEVYFGQWLASADKFYKGFNFYIKECDYHEAAFLLHQAAERYYTCLLLVLTDYRPPTHSLKKLDLRACIINREISKAFPRADKEQKRLFKLLERAYIETRYKMDAYQITQEDFDYLVERVSVLRELVEKLCKEHIELLRGEVGKGETGDGRVG